MSTDHTEENTVDLEIAEKDELEVETSAEFEMTSEPLDDQLKKLAQVIADQVEQDEAAAPVILEENTEQELEAQIAEDQALEKLLKDENEAQEKQEPSPLASLGHELNIHEIQSCIEALLFISDKPLSLDKLRQLLGPEFDRSLFEEAMTSLISRYQAVHHGFELVEINGGYQFRTKAGRSNLAQKLVKVQTQRLSGGAMESLAIIAYKQPIMKEEIDKIRGVDSSYFIRGLLEKKLIKISGRSELPGRPILYTTTEEFLELFGLRDLNSLPSLRELEQMVPGSQTQNPEDEDPRIREMRKLVSQMKADKSSALHYNPKEDEKILKEIREKVSSIPTSTPYLDELKAAEVLAEEQAKQSKKAAEEALEEPSPVVEAAPTA